MSNASKMTKSSARKSRSKLADNLEYYMEQKGFKNRSEFERIAGVKKDVVRRLLAGHMQNTSPENAAMLASALGISVDDLLGINSVSVDIASVNIAPGAIIPRWHLIKSDEMSPTLNPGDYVLVDFGVTAVSVSGIYLITSKSGDHSVRRIADRLAISNKIFVSVDNKDKYEPDGEVDIKKINIAGKVIGTYRGL